MAVVAARYAFPSVSVAKARDSLPAYLELARRHLPQIVTRHDRDEVALLALTDLREVLRAYRFETEAAVHQGEATVALPQFSIIGIGDSLDEAIEDALEKLREYAQHYLQRYEFYRHTDRRALFPLVLRVIATPEEQQRELLLEPQESEAAPAPA